MIIEFQKTLKRRLLRNFFSLILGIILVVTAVMAQNSNCFFSSFGFALAAIGISQSILNIRLMRSSKACKEREIAEKDERNIMLALKSRSWAFSLYMMLAGAAVIVLSVMAKHEIAQIIAWSVCILVALYYVCYLILRKKY